MSEGKFMSYLRVSTDKQGAQRLGYQSSNARPEPMPEMGQKLT
jgi:hypothetical protein